MRLKIAIISRGTELSGGASKVAIQIHELLNENGHYSQHYRRNLENGYTENSVSVYGKYEKWAKKTYYKLKKIGFQEIIPWEYFFLKNEIKKNQYDLIHFHDITASISIISLFLLRKKIPIVWTAHDTSPFTGGCYRTNNCDHYLNACFNCPQIGQWPLGETFDLSFFFYWLKKKLYKSNKIHLITPSKWLQKFALQSKITVQAPTNIANYVDATVFKPESNNTDRKKLGILPEQFVIIVSASFISDPLKGIDHVIKVLEKIKHINPYILIIGRTNLETRERFSMFNTLFTGYINNDLKLSDYLALSDILLNCSLADSFSLTSLEAISCGTPVLGFKVGGIPEIIQNDVNGYLVELGNTGLLAEKILEIHANKKYKQWSTNARKTVLNKFNKDIFYKKHFNLYQDAISKFRKN